MSANLSIRTATKKDAKLLADIGARTFRATYRSNVDRNALEEYLTSMFSRERISADLTDPDCTFLLAFVNGEVVGYAHLKAGDAPMRTRSPHPVELVRIYLDQSAIGKGFGTLLMKACLEQASKKGFETIWLGVWEQNKQAQEFYHKWEFQKVGSQEFTLGNEVHTDIIMERPVKQV